MIWLGQPDPVKNSQAIYMHQITLHAIYRAASGIVPNRFPFCTLFSQFPLSSLNLMISNPSVTLPLTLTLQSLIVKLVSVYLFYSLNSPSTTPLSRDTILIFILPSVFLLSSAHPTFRHSGKVWIFPFDKGGMKSIPVGIGWETQWTDLASSSHIPVFFKYCTQNLFF